MMLSLLPVLLLALSANAASLLTLQSPRFIVKDSTGQQLRAGPLSLSQKLSPAVTLNTTDTLKITFQVVDKDSGNGVQPHQTFLRFYDPKSGEEGIQPVRVTAGGKAKFELNMSKPPLSLPPTNLNDPLSVTLILGSATYSPLKADIFDLLLPPSLPASSHPDEATFHVLPEIHHTFRPEQKLPPRPVSAFFSLLVIAPWLVLVGLWSQVSPRPAHLFSPSVLPFILTLGAFEVLLFWYWVDLKLGQVLTYGAILGVVTVFTGRNALASIGARRLQQKK